MIGVTTEVYFRSIFTILSKSEKKIENIKKQISPSFLLIAEFLKNNNNEQYRDSFLTLNPEQSKFENSYLSSRHCVDAREETILYWSHSRCYWNV